jgi:hypothetical protein
MAAQLANAGLADTGAVYEAPEGPLAGFDRIGSGGDGWAAAVRTLTVDVLIALPFWVLVVFVVYLVL